MTRDEVLIEFALRADAQPWGTDMAHRQVNLMADEVVRLRQERDDLREMVSATQWGETVASAELEQIRRILAALREPSDMVVDAIREYVLDLSRFDDALKAIQVAVAAAEKEANNTQENTNAYCEEQQL